MDSFIKFALDVMNDHMLMVIFLFVLFFFSKLLFLKKHIYSLFDPLFLFLVFNTCSLITVFFVCFYKDNFHGFYDFLIFDICFFLPAIFIKPINFRLYRASFSLVVNNDGYLFYKIIASIFIIPTFLLWFTRGVPLFAENVTDAKVLLYAGGFGVVRYIHFILPLYLFFVGVLFFLDTNGNVKKSIIKKTFILILLMFVFLFFLTSGSKSGIVPMLFCLAFANECYPESNKYFLIKKILILFLLIAIALVFVVLVFSGLQETGIIEAAFTALGIRLLASGDLFYFWYEFNLENTYTPNFNLTNYVFQPLFSMLGITSHEYPLGAIIMNEATGYPITSFGPNAQLPVVMALAWGPLKYLGAFFAGTSLFLLRYKSFYFMRKFGSGGAILFSLVFFYVSSIYTDVNYFLSMLYSFLILFAPLYIIFNFLIFGFRNGKNI